MAKKQPLKGCVVAFCGSFYGHSQTSLLNDAARLGAHTAKSVTKNVTHLVTTKTECAKQSSKVIQARDQGVFIVSLDWVLESEQAASKQPESKFALGPASTSASTASSSSAPDASKKRAASESPAPDAKKSKLDQAHEKAPPMGKSQLAKDSSSVRVPLDEGCSLSGYSVHVSDDGVIWDATLK